MNALITRELDLRGLTEAAPVLKTRRAINDLHSGEVLLITTTDCSIVHDMDTWCEQTGNTLLQSSEEDGEFTFIIRKSHCKKGTDLFPQSVVIASTAKQ